MVEAAKLICIVDDDRSVRRALGRLTRSFGFDVETIASGRECLDGAYIDRADCLDGEEFIAVAAGGSDLWGSPKGGTVLVFGLPKRWEPAAKK